ncbi:MAG: AMP-binding enzyme, partial [Ferrovibrionaceae bacterium]
ISGGENIYPAELEAVLAACEGIAEATVVGRADPRWGEVPVAVVVSALTEAEILGLFEGRLARYKHPRAVAFVDRLPRNVMGKVLKHEVRTWLGG